MNRRHLLAAVPAAVAVGPVIAPASPDETPVMQLYREWEQLLEIAERNGVTLDDGANDVFWNPVYEIESRIMATPSRSCRDWVAKAMVGSVGGNVDLNCKSNIPEMWAEARTFVSASE